MSMIPWESGILVPPADIELPDWLRGTADIVGFQFPKISERALFSLGQEYARLARNFEQTRESTDDATSSLLTTNFGEAIAAFSMFRERLSGPNASHMAVSAAAAGVIAAAYCGAGVEVVAMKLKVIAAMVKAFLKSEAVAALAATVPETAPGIMALGTIAEGVLTALTAIVIAGERGVTALFQVAGRVLELYTSVATPVLQNRPTDEQRGDVPYVAVPGGLAAHEGVAPKSKGDGHTLSKHVNVDDQYIKDRVDGGAPEASRWIDRRTAERVTAQVIGLNQATIAAWLASSGKKPLVLHAAGANGVTGRYVGELNGTPRDVTGARVVLKKDPARPGGYFILTSFPEP